MKTKIGKAMSIMLCVVLFATVFGVVNVSVSASGNQEILTIASGIDELQFSSTQYGYSGTAVLTYAYNWGNLIPGAYWVWSEYPQSPEHLATGDHVTFWTSFELPSYATISATIQITVDDGYTLYMNGQYVGDSGYPYVTHDDINAPGQWQWGYVRSYDVSGFLHAGTNVLRIDAWNGAWGVGYETWNPAGLLFKMDIAYTPMIPVTIDIKPGSYPNSINLGSRGTIPVAILSSEDFDATTVNASTVELGGAGVAIRGKGALMASEEDVNGDGLVDLVVHVDTKNLDPTTFQNGSVQLTGETYGGQLFEGWDTVTIVPEG